VVDALPATSAGQSGRVFASRQRAVALVALAAIILQAVAGTAFAVLNGLDFNATIDVATLVGRGAGTADFFRWALLVDMLSYLAVAPLVLHLYGRLRVAADMSEGRTWLVRVATFAGVSFSIVGAIGGALTASFGPPLIEAARAGGAAAEAAQVTFAALASAVYVGLWGPLDWLLAGIWVGTVGWFVRTEGRAFANLGMLAGAGLIVYATRVGVTGRTPSEVGDPIDFVLFAAVGLFVAWEAWLAARLWFGR
jgi:hypothetical protein